MSSLVERFQAEKAAEKAGAKPVLWDEADCLEIRAELMQEAKRLSALLLSEGKQPGPLPASATSNDIIQACDDLEAHVAQLKAMQKLPAGGSAAAPTNSGKLSLTERCLAATKAAPVAVTGGTLTERCLAAKKASQTQK